MSNLKRELTVAVCTRDYLLDDVIDGDITKSDEFTRTYTYDRANYDADAEGWAEWINDLTNVFKSEGVEFQGQTVATLPDGSYTIDYRDGMEREVSAWFTTSPDLPDWGTDGFTAALQEIVDQQAVVLRVG